MTAEYEKLISDHDRTLAMLRQCWQEAKGPEETSKWWGRINQSLDERIRLMKARDAAKAIQSNVEVSDAKRSLD